MWHNIFLVEKDYTDLNTTFIKIILRMSKTIIYGHDIDEYLRCPYRFIKSKKEGVESSDYLDSNFVKEVLIRNGIKFEKEIFSTMDWKKTSEPLEKLVKKECIVQLPLIVLNGSDIREDVPSDFSKIRFVGRPDMLICTGKGIFPADIKHHKNITKIDVYRLGFYAFLIKVKFGFSPATGLILGKAGIQEIDIQSAYWDVIALIDNMYQDFLDKSAVRPRRSQECEICSLKEECLVDLRTRKDLTLIHGIGPIKAKKLKEEGIKNIDDLLNQDKYKLFRLRAKSLTENRIIKIGDFFIPDGNYVFFDIETDMGEKVWLIGYLYKNKFMFLYADKLKEEKKIISEFLIFLKTIKNPILISYSCSNFDWNLIYGAIRRHKLNYKFIEKIPHYDIGLLLKRSYIFPNMSFKLKEIGSFLNYPFKHDDLDGRLVASAYLKHLETKKELSQKYLDYNEDDVRAIPFIISKVNEQKGVLVDIIEKKEKQSTGRKHIKWSDEDIAIIVKRYPIKGSIIKELLNRGHSRDSIRVKAIELGIRCKFTGGTGRKLTIEDMKNLAKKRGGKCLSVKYINSTTKLKWQCKEGHEWEVAPTNIKSGTWCPWCAYYRRLKKGK
jgi:predicted RecB family nuclease